VYCVLPVCSSRVCLVVVELVMLLMELLCQFIAIICSFIADFV
jgi:hypothetical protein